MAKINSNIKSKNKLQRKKKLKTKKQINKLKGGSFVLKENLMNFICSLDHNPIDISIYPEKAKKYNGNYPFILSYFDIEIILLYIILFFKNEQAKIFLIILHIKINENDSNFLNAIFNLINETLSGINFNDYCNITIKENKLNFEYDNVQYQTEKHHDKFKQYLQLPKKFFNIYNLFYKEKVISEITKKNTNSGYKSNTSNTSNNLIGVSEINTIINENSTNNKSLYSNIRKTFYIKYKQIFDDNGIIINNKKLDKLLELKII